MQVMGDMLERIVQSSAQQSEQTAASDHHVGGSGSSKPGDELAPSAANGGANAPTPILPGTVPAMHL